MRNWHVEWWNSKVICWTMPEDILVYPRLVLLWLAVYRNSYNITSYYELQVCFCTVWKKLVILVFNGLMTMGNTHEFLNPTLCALQVPPVSDAESITQSPS